jgi:FixJ family two-component response regulator
MDRPRVVALLAQRLGANLLSEEAHEELIATGARPRRLVLSGADALTPSERRIAAMAAEGLSNREITQALFVTPRRGRSCQRRPRRRSRPAREQTLRSCFALANPYKTLIT